LPVMWSSRAQVETAYRVVRDKNEWRVADIRLGDRHWESFELIEEAVRRERFVAPMGCSMSWPVQSLLTGEREGRYVGQTGSRFSSTPFRRGSLRLRIDSICGEKSSITGAV
jgi:hypothetical protein